jgi:hypothetical protein
LSRWKHGDCVKILQKLKLQSGIPWRTQNSKAGRRSVNVKVGKPICSLCTWH